MFKKFLSIFLSAVLVLAITGCSGKTDDSDPSPHTQNAQPEEKGSTLRLLYCENDTFNPYKTISKLNAELASLMYDPLVKTDDSFDEIYVLAKKIVTKKKVCTVTLINTTFSDETPLTAEDVIFSYELAKKSDRYSHLLYEVEKVEATDEKTVTFTLDREDPYFFRLLCFPILKKGSDQLKNDDNVELPPIGTGRFILNEVKAVMTPNPSYFGDKPSVTQISLINAPDDESMRHYVEVGATDLYFADAGEENIIRMSGQKASVNLNHLVYIGINHDYAPLKSDEIRHILASAISRSDILKNAFYSNGVPANGFFHPSWKETEGYQTLSDTANLKICVENLADIGYNILNEDGYYENSAGKVLEFDLLVNKSSFTKTTAANLIKKQLGDAGIKINVKAVSEKQFLSALESGSFQLYLGEVRLQQNMDISSLVLKGGKAAFGIPEADNKAEDDIEDEKPKDPEDFSGETGYISVLKGFYDGENSVSDLATSLLASMPVVPVIYRSSVVFYSDEILNIGEVSCYDIFLSADKYK